MRKLTQLEIMHLAVTELRRFSDEVLPDRIKFFTAHNGQKLYNADGSMSKKIVDQNMVSAYGQMQILAEFGTYYINHQWYIKKSHSNIWLDLTVAVHGGSHEDGNYFHQNLGESHFVGEQPGNTFIVADNIHSIIPTDPIPSIAQLQEWAKSALEAKSVYDRWLSTIDSRFHESLNLK